MRKVNRASTHSQQGSIHVFMSIMLPPLLAIIALAVDGFLIMTSNIQQDNNAEYAALFALKEFRNASIYEDRFQKATSEAEKISGLNFYIGTGGTAQMQQGGLNGTYGNITFGHVSSNGLFSNGPMRDASNQVILDVNGLQVYNAISVKLKTTSNSGIIARFSKILNLKLTHSASTVTAWWNPSDSQYRILR